MQNRQNHRLFCIFFNKFAHNFTSSRFQDFFSLVLSRFQDFYSLVFSRFQDFCSFPSAQNPRVLPSIHAFSVIVKESVRRISSEELPTCT